MEGQSRGTAKSNFPKWTETFIPSREIKVTPILISLNVLMWIAMVMTGVNPLGPDPETALRWGATATESVAQGEYWRLITSNYIHFGLMHLAFNMFALNNIGRILERFIGSMRFGILYTLTGIAASAVSVWWNPYAAGAGASGAILGIVGVFAALLTTNLIERNARMEMLKSIGISVGLTLLMGLNAHIDNAAHIGGLLVGAAGGYLIYFDLKARYLERRNSSSGIIIAAVLSVAVTVLFLSQLNPVQIARRPEIILSEINEGQRAIVLKMEDVQYNTPEYINSTVLPAYDKFILQADTLISFAKNEESGNYLKQVKTNLQTRRKGYYYINKSYYDPVFSDSARLWMMKADAESRKLSGQ
jgi:rhomboid protease GluP